MRRIYLMSLLFLCVSCVSVPRQAPKLSRQLGQQLNELEASHLTLVHRFFDHQRQKIHRFVDDDWMPLFAQNFFQQPAVAKAWKQVVKAGDAHDRLEFIKRVYPEIQQQSHKKYQEMVQPLNTLEGKLVAAVRKKYTTSKTVNQTLTNYLSSAAKTSELRTTYLGKVGIHQKNIDEVLNQAAHYSNEALQGAEEMKTIETQIENYKEEIEALLSKF